MRSYLEFSPPGYTCLEFSTFFTNKANVNNATIPGFTYILNKLHFLTSDFVALGTYASISHTVYAFELDRRLGFS